MIVKSFSFDQNEILKGILQLHCEDETFEIDLTYGNGNFYKEIPKPKYKIDIDPQEEGVLKQSSVQTSFKSNTFKSVIFDPPFLTYVSRGRVGNGKMVMSRRYSGYWKYTELEDHYQKTLDEVNRILVNKGILVFKCQDIIHNHRMHSTHTKVIQWASERDFRIKDIFVLGAKHRMPSPQKGIQRHSRTFHSYFLVFERNKRK